MRKYQLNENYFEKIDTEDKAYWLGFISADGTIVQTNKISKSLRLRINLHEKDECVLEKLRECIESTSPIKSFISNKGKEKLESHQVKIDINSNKLCGDLMKLGVVHNKTYTLEMPSIPKHLERHYIRGYFDGDGYMGYGTRKNGDKERYVYGFEIVGQSESVLQSIQNCFKENDIKTSIYTRKSNNSKRLMTGSSKQIRKIISYLYDGSTIFLERKFEIAKQILQISLP